MKILFSAIIFLSALCGKGTRHVKFVHYQNYSGKTQKIIFRGNIPTGYRPILFTAGGEGTEQQYLFPDSSMIYLSDMSGLATINYDNIIRSGSYSKRFEYMLLAKKEPLISEGVNSKGFYWKEIVIGDAAIGYELRTASRKEEFDRAIISLISKK